MTVICRRYASFTEEKLRYSIKKKTITIIIVFAAIGYSECEPDDICVADVFRHADKMTYERKREMKGQK